MDKKEQIKPDIKRIPSKLKKLSDIWILPTVRDIVKEDDKGNLSEIFHANTKMTPYSEQQVGIRTLEMLNSLPVERRTSQGYKNYGPSIPNYPLVPREEFSDSTADLFETIVNRRTIRKYSEKTLTMEDVSKLLYYSYGISGKIKLVQGTEQDVRVISSGGGLYPLEVYLMVVNVAHLPKGIYHYNVRKHSLELIKEGFEISDILPYLPGLIASQTRTVSLFLLLSAAFHRTTHKYGPRGYRYVCFEAGTFMGHLQLAAEALNIGSCQVAGYYDDILNEMLGLDGVDEAVMNICAMGYKPENSGEGEFGAH
ncbi:MAG: SagB/ThcOx family dehydrogenase [Candidatus Omnitrophota bacterium]